MKLGGSAAVSKYAFYCSHFPPKRKSGRSKISETGRSAADPVQIKIEERRFFLVEVFIGWRLSLRRQKVWLLCCELGLLSLGRYAGGLVQNVETCLLSNFYSHVGHYIEKLTNRRTTRTMTKIRVGHKNQYQQSYNIFC